MPGTAHGPTRPASPPPPSSSTPTPPRLRPSRAPAAAPPPSTPPLLASSSATPTPRLLVAPPPPRRTDRTAEPPLLASSSATPTPSLLGPRRTVKPPPRLVRTAAPPAPSHLLVSPALSLLFSLRPAPTLPLPFFLRVGTAPLAAGVGSPGHSCRAVLAGFVPCLARPGTVRAVPGRPTVPRWRPRHGPGSRAGPARPMNSACRAVLVPGLQCVLRAGPFGPAHLASTTSILNLKCRKILVLSCHISIKKIGMRKIL